MKKYTFYLLLISLVFTFKNQSMGMEKPRNNENLVEYLDTAKDFATKSTLNSLSKDELKLIFEELVPLSKLFDFELPKIGEDFFYNMSVIFMGLTQNKNFTETDKDRYIQICFEYFENFVHQVKLQNPESTLFLPKNSSEFFDDEVLSFILCLAHHCREVIKDTKYFTLFIRKFHKDDFINQRLIQLLPRMDILPGMYNLYFSIVKNSIPLVSSEISGKNFGEILETAKQKKQSFEEENDRISQEVICYITGKITALYSSNPRVKEEFAAIQREIRAGNDWGPAENLKLSKFILENYSLEICSHQNLYIHDLLKTILKDKKALQFLIVNAIEVILIIPDRPRIERLQFIQDGKTRIEKRVLYILRRV